MILATSAIIQALHDGAIVCDPLPGRVEGAHIDVTLGEWHWQFDASSFDMLSLANTDPRKWFDLYTSTDLVYIPPHGFVLACTAEAIGTAPGSGLVPMLHTRSTLARWGLSVCTANAGMGDQGWIGPWTLEIINPHPVAVALPVGARIGAIVFHRLEGVAADYEPGTRYNAARSEWTPDLMLPRRANW